MDCQQAFVVAMTVVGFRAIVTGIHQELLHVTPGHDETITTEWDSRFNHEEYLLAWLGDVGVVGTLAAFRWKYAAVLPVAAGGIEVGYSLVAVSHYVREPGFCTTVQTFDGTTRLILGAEPFLLVAGGLLFLSAGVVVWRTRHDCTNTHRHGAKTVSRGTPR